MAAALNWILEDTSEIVCETIGALKVFSVFTSVQISRLAVPTNGLNCCAGCRLYGTTIHIACTSMYLLRRVLRLSMATPWLQASALPALAPYHANRAIHINRLLLHSVPPLQRGLAITAIADDTQVTHSFHTKPQFTTSTGTPTILAINHTCSHRGTPPHTRRRHPILRSRPGRLLAGGARPR